MGTSQHPLSQALPACVVIRSKEANHTFQQLSAMMVEVVHAGLAGRQVLLNKLADALFTLAVCDFAQRADERRGLFASLADPRIARVMQAVYENPGLTWTMQSMASLACMSRSAFRGTLHPAHEGSARAIRHAVARKRCGATSARSAAIGGGHRPAARLQQRSGVPSPVQAGQRHLPWTRPRGKLPCVSDELKAPGRAVTAVHPVCRGYVDPPVSALTSSSPGRRPGEVNRGSRLAVGP